MSRKVFTPEERHAVFTVHGEKCYLHGGIIDVLTMEVDHIIPEHLLDEPEKLAKVLKLYGLPPDFDLNSFANWLPACGPCNNQKRGTVFDPTPIVQIQLQRAASKAKRAAEIASETVHTQTVTKAVNTLKKAFKANKITNEMIDELRPFLAYHEKKREPERVGKPVQLLPLYEVLSESGGTTIVKGPYGIGGGPSGPNVSDQMRCTCGFAFFNGARCVICGEMGDF